MLFFPRFLNNSLPPSAHIFIISKKKKLKYGHGFEKSTVNGNNTISIFHLAMVIGISGKCNIFLSSGELHDSVSFACFQADFSHFPVREGSGTMTQQLPGNWFSIWWKHNRLTPAFDINAYLFPRLILRNVVYTVFTAHCFNHCKSRHPFTLWLFEN